MQRAFQPGIENKGHTPHYQSECFPEYRYAYQSGNMPLPTQSLTHQQLFYTAPIHGQVSPPSRNILDSPSLYTNLCVSKLPPYMSDDGLELAFMALFPGRTSDDVVVSAKVMRDVSTGTSKGYGFVLFRHPCDAEFAKSHPPIVPDVDVMKIVRRNQRRGFNVTPAEVARTTGTQHLVVQVARHSGHNAGNSSQGKSDEQASIRRVYIGNIPFYVSPRRVEAFFSAMARQLSHNRPGVDPTILSTSVRADDETVDNQRHTRGVRGRGRAPPKTDAVKETYHGFFLQLWEASHKMFSRTDQGIRGGHWLDTKVTSFYASQGQKCSAGDLLFLRHCLPLSENGAVDTLPIPPPFMMFIEFKDSKVAQDVIIKVHGKQPFTLADSARDVVDAHSSQMPAANELIKYLVASTSAFPLVEFPDAPDCGRVILLPNLGKWLRIPSFLKFRSSGNVMSSLRNLNDDSSSDDELVTYAATARPRRCPVPPLFVKAAENKERRDERVKVIALAPKKLDSEIQIRGDYVATRNPSLATFSPLLGTDMLRNLSAHNERYATSYSPNQKASSITGVGSSSTVVRSEKLIFPMITTIVDSEEHRDDPLHSEEKHGSSSSPTADESLSRGANAGSFGTSSSGDSLISMLQRRSVQVIVEHCSSTGRQSYYFQCAETNQRVFIGSVESPVSLFVTFDRHESTVRRSLVHNELREREALVNRFVPLIGASLMAIHKSSLSTADSAEGCRLPNEFDGSTTAFGGEILRAQSSDSSSREFSATIEPVMSIHHEPPAITMRAACQDEVGEGRGPVGPPHVRLPVMAPFTTYVHCGLSSQGGCYPQALRSEGEIPHIMFPRQVYFNQFPLQCDQGAPQIAGVGLPHMQPILNHQGQISGSCNNTMCTRSLSSALAQPSSSPIHTVGSKSAVDFNNNGPLSNQKVAPNIPANTDHASTANSFSVGYATMPQIDESGDLHRLLADSLQWSAGLEGSTGLRGR